MNTYRTTTGHAFSTSQWLDLHFDALFTEYELMIDLVGIKGGWHVLDAGCGNGRFIDLIDKRVGSKGKISALDLAPENIKAVEKKIASHAFLSKVSTHVGDVTSLPFPNNSFDALWCAAVTQYLTEKQVIKALKEFKRVVKPGGIIAIKEFDGISGFYYPMSEFTLLWKSVDTMDPFDKQRLLIHPLEMQGLLKKVRLKNVSQKTILAERRHPLRLKDRRYIESLIQTDQVSWANIETLSHEDQKKWKALLSKDSRKYILKQANFYWREGHVVSIGKV